MKIAFLHMTMGANERGSEISTDLLASKLAKKHQILMLQAGKEESSSYEVKRIMRLKNLPSVAPNNLWQKLLFRTYLDTFSKLIKTFSRLSIPTLKKFNPDIIIPVNGAPQIQIIKEVFPDKKIVIFGRAGIGYHDLDSLNTSPDLFIALSRESKKWADKYANQSTRVILLPNPIDPKPFFKGGKQQLNLKSPIVLTVAAFSKYKNIDLVIQAVAKTSASLCIVGGGEEEKKLKSLAQILLPKRHLFLKLDHTMLPKIYNSADIFCFMPDKQEAFGRVYLEAMAAGLPIIAPNDKIRREIIGENGFFCDYEVDTIAKQIGKSSNARPINYGSELERFDLDIIAKKLEAELVKITTNEAKSAS